MHRNPLRFTRLVVAIESSAHLFHFTSTSIAERHPRSPPGTRDYMRIGSGQFIGVLVLIASGAAAAGLALDSRPLLWCAVVVGAYALHLLDLHTVARDVDTRSSRAAARDDRKALKAEREEVDRLRRELESKLAQADKQWTLLRSMVQDRLRRSAHTPDPSSRSESESEIDAHTAPAGSSARDAKARPAAAETNRAYGRW